MQSDKPKDASGVLAGHYTMNLETYKRNDDPVRTPVWCIVENGERFYSEHRPSQARQKESGKIPLFVSFPVISVERFWENG